MIDRKPPSRVADNFTEAGKVYLEKLSAEEIGALTEDQKTFINYLVEHLSEMAIKISHHPDDREVKGIKDPIEKFKAQATQSEHVYQIILSFLKDFDKEKEISELNIILSAVHGEATPVKMQIQEKIKEAAINLYKTKIMPQLDSESEMDRANAHRAGEAINREYRKSLHENKDQKNTLLIDSYVNHLMPDNGEKENFYVSTAMGIEELKPNSLQSFYNRISSKAIVIPIRASNHWRAVYIEKNASDVISKVTIFDSYGERSASYIENTIRESLGLSPDFSIGKEGPSASQRQADGYSCGDFVIAFSHQKASENGAVYHAPYVTTLQNNSKDLRDVSIERSRELDDLSKKHLTESKPDLSPLSPSPLDIKTHSGSLSTSPVVPPIITTPVPPAPIPPSVSTTAPVAPPTLSTPTVTTSVPPAPIPSSVSRIPSVVTPITPTSATAVAPAPMPPEPTPLVFVSPTIPAPISTITTPVVPAPIMPLSISTTSPVVTPTIATSTPTVTTSISPAPTPPPSASTTTPDVALVVRTPSTEQKVYNDAETVLRQVAGEWVAGLIEKSGGNPLLIKPIKKLIDNEELSNTSEITKKLKALNKRSKELNISDTSINRVIKDVASLDDDISSPISGAAIGVCVKNYLKPGEYADCKIIEEKNAAKNGEFREILVDGLLKVVPVTIPGKTESRLYDDGMNIVPSLAKLQYVDAMLKPFLSNSKLAETPLLIRGHDDVDYIRAIMLLCKVYKIKVNYEISRQSSDVLANYEPTTTEITKVQQEVAKGTLTPINLKEDKTLLTTELKNLNDAKLQIQALTSTNPKKTTLLKAINKAEKIIKHTRKGKVTGDTVDEFNELITSARRKI